MRLRCPDSSPGKGQTGVASAQERKTNALTPLHSCNSSRGNVGGEASHWMYHNPRHLPWPGKPHLSPGNSNTCLGAPRPWVSLSTAAPWPKHVSGHSSPGWSRVNKVPTLRRRLRRLVSLPPHKGGIGQAWKMPQLAWVSPRGPTSVTSRFNLSILWSPASALQSWVGWLIPDTGPLLLSWNILNLLPWNRSVLPGKASGGGSGAERMRWNPGDEV